MAMNAVRVLLALAIVMALGCKAKLKDLIDEADAHLVPTFICNGDPTPTYATWTKPEAVKGRVKVYTKDGGRKLCEAKLKTEYCAFAPPALTQADVPLEVRFYQHGEEVGRRDKSYTVLDGPKWTQKYLANSVLLADAEIITGTVWVPIYETCDHCKKDASGNIIEKCDCPNQGRVIGMEPEPLSITQPKTASVLWENIDATWFSPRVQTRRVEYSQGTPELAISGPGIDGSVTFTAGDIKAGNSVNPAGAWLGSEKLNGPAISYNQGVEDLVPTIQHKLRLEVACSN